MYSEEYQEFLSDQARRNSEEVSKAKVKYGRPFIHERKVEIKPAKAPVLGKSKFPHQKGLK